MVPKTVRLVQDVRDESGDSDFFLPAGTLLQVEFGQDDLLWANDGAHSFPLQADEYVVVAEGGAQA